MTSTITAPADSKARIAALVGGSSQDIAAQATCELTEPASFGGPAAAQMSPSASAAR